ncbi:ABC transporter ATP-binding protein [Hamadaea sp. NPDC051192]|uniref:ABC transporter ATP-binding protein n=1 Tax=Hamadaea sp. NPDC051192 TaxID=3154940 RepID=UPI0034400EDE
MTGRSPRRAAAAALALAGRAAAGPLIAAALVTALAGMGPAVAAWLSKLLIDGLAGATPASPARLAGLAAAAAAATGAALALGYAAGFLHRRAEAAIAHRAQAEIYQRVSGFGGLRRFEDPAFADELRLATDAAAEAPSVLTNFLFGLVRSVVTIGSLVGVVVAVWPPMAVLLLVVTVFAVVAQLTVARRQADVARAVMATHRRRIAYQELLTDLRSAKEVRLYGLAGLFRDRMLGAMRTAVSAELRIQGRSAVVQGSLSGLGSVALAVGAALVAYRIAGGELTPGDFALFLAAATAVQGALLGMVNSLQDAVRCTRLFGHYLNVAQAPDDLVEGTARPGPLRTGIVFEDVWFRYDESGPWVLRGVDLVIPAGSSTGLVGRNGAGKSTLVKLLCRFYDPDRGRITWDGVDLRDLPLSWLRRRISATFQDFQTYELPVGENIALGDVEAMQDKGRVVAAARAVGLHDTIEALPAAYDTMLSRIFVFDGSDDPGVQLSGGQNQRLALARSLLRTDADLLILDEPSSGLDPVAEHDLAEVIRRTREGRTGLHISHRLGTMRQADDIVVLADGVVVEHGTHDALMALDGEYAELFRLQAANYQAAEAVAG